MENSIIITLTQLCLILAVKTLMSRGLSGAVELSVSPPALQCNESVLLLEMERCGDTFRTDISFIHPDHRCNLTHFIRQYHSFSLCTELNSERVGCFWPNPWVERFILRQHRLLFSSCRAERVELLDPPEGTLALLILLPVGLTLAMVALVVWCSKRSDVLA
ncbi:receptor activity-modifying protein 3-like isoform X1 [Danio rerio]|uniref:Receptor activity-modifying protein 3-like isoform X1 n=1 Tax=Danio rerio TaxID=7955 RepID=A0AC58ISY9_DANRE